MTIAPPPESERHRPPSYAALHEPAKAEARPPEARLTQQVNLTQFLSHYALAPFFTEEAHRLQALKDQMWAAFQTDPTSAPSLQLFEATRTYTVALNSQLQVIGYRRPKAIPPKVSDAKPRTA